MAISLPGCEDRNLNWRKAMRSVNAGACAEVASAAGVVVVRDSQDPLGLLIQYPAGSWRTFLSGARAGRFDEIR